MVGRSDTVLVNSRKPVLLPVHALDAKGRERRTAGVRYTIVAGDSVPVSSKGAVTCLRRGETTLRATLGSVTTDFLLLCRPVKGFRFVVDPEPLLVGGPPRMLAVGAVGIDDLPVLLLAGTATVHDSDIASLRGLTVVPRGAGYTEVAVDIGDCVHSMFIEVDQPVKSSLDLERRDQVFMVSPLRLASGEIRSWPIPRGEYVLWLRPARNARDHLVLGGVGENCLTWPDVGQKYHCLAFDHAAVIVRNRQPAGRGGELKGDLFIKRMDAPAPVSSAPARPVQRLAPRGKPACRLVR